MTRPQTIFRRVHTHNFTVIANTVLNDQRLSLDEKGFLCWLLSRPPDWEVIPTACQKMLGIGRSAFYRMVKSLRELGYINREWVRAEDGTVIKVQYTVFDTTDSGATAPEPPLDDFPEVDETQAIQTEPVPDSPLVEKPDAGINNDIYNNPPKAPKPAFRDLVAIWPSAHVLSNVASEKKFLRLKENQQQHAIDRAKAYLADMASRGWKVCDLGTYLRERRFERLAKPSSHQMTLAKPGTPQGFRWKEFLEAVGKWTRYLQHMWDTRQPFTVPSEWPPAMPAHRATGPPEPGAEFSDEFDTHETEPAEAG